MIPTAWQGLVLAMAAYRLTRLGGWDDFPPVARVRSWLLGEVWVSSIVVTAGPLDLVCRECGARGVTVIGVSGCTACGAEHPENVPESLSEPFSAAEPGLPGKTPSSEIDDVRPAYTRPLLAHLVHCPFCLGWWISAAVYATWLAFPTVALTIAAPLAIAAFVGLVAKNLDP